MQRVSTQLDEVFYNASTQCFEALVTVHAATGPARYACAIDAPITMPFEAAASGLATQALRRHAGGRGLHSQFNPAPPAAPRTRSGRAPFDLRGWLEQLVSRPGTSDQSGQRAA
ncbi:MAG: orotidine 5-phosphate decarboxylase [Sulfitobacter sp.]